MGEETGFGRVVVLCTTAGVAIVWIWSVGLRRGFLRGFLVSFNSKPQWNQYRTEVDSPVRLQSSTTTTRPSNLSTPSLPHALSSPDRRFAPFAETAEKAFTDDSSHADDSAHPVALTTFLTPQLVVLFQSI
jgi:hypothetical protein